MSHRTIRRPRPPIALRRAPFTPGVHRVLEILDRAGHRSWVVGGAVRDALLGRPRPGGDVDVATPARPERVRELFPKTIPTGIEHGTVTVVVGREQVEVTTFRGEGVYVDGRHPTHVTFLDDLEGDLARRDFTVNAMAWDPIGGVFCDPFGGRADLRRRRLRAVGEPADRFGEDGLRPLRAARFAAQLGFSLDGRTARAIPGALPTVRRVAVERITDELSRLLVAREARRGLELLRTTGLLELVVPALAGVSARRLAHAFGVVARCPPDLPVRLAALLHVAPAPADEDATDAVVAALSQLRFSGQVRAHVAALVAHHRCLAVRRPVPAPTDDVEARRWLSGVEDRPAVLALARAEVRALGATAAARRHRAELSSFERRIARILRGAPPLCTAQLALDGRAVMAALGVPGGPVVGAALRHLLERVLVEPRMNTRERLTSELQRWAATEAASGPRAPRPERAVRPLVRHGPGRPC